MLDKTEQSDRAPNPIRNRKVVTADPACAYLLYAMAGRQALVSKAASRCRRLRQPAIAEQSRFMSTRPGVAARRRRPAQRETSQHSPACTKARMTWGRPRTEASSHRH